MDKKHRTEMENHLNDAFQLWLSSSPLKDKQRAVITKAMATVVSEFAIALPVEVDAEHAQKLTIATLCYMLSDIIGFEDQEKLGHSLIERAKTHQEIIHRSVN